MILRNVAVSSFLFWGAASADEVWSPWSKKGDSNAHPTTATFHEAGEKVNKESRAAFVYLCMNTLLSFFAMSQMGFCHLALLHFDFVFDWKDLLCFAKQPSLVLDRCRCCLG